jgi:transposase-like protein
MLPNVQQATIQPIIRKTVSAGSLVYTDEYDIYARLEDWGYGHKSVCHAWGEYARRAIQFWMGLAETLVERVQHIVVIVKRV